MKRNNAALAATVVLSIAVAASAEPSLQLYLEGGTYNAATKTWVIPDASSSLRLWVIGNTSQGSIHDVRLSAAYAADETPTLALTGSTTGGYGGFTDPSTAADAAYLQTVSDGSSPLLWDGTSFPSHDVFGPGTDWQEFALGDFTLSDSPIADFVGSLPAPGNMMGQINVYDLTVSGASVVHFDVYDHITGSTHAVFVPPSHDGQVVPAPAAALLALIGIGTVGLLRRHLR